MRPRRPAAPPAALPIPFIRRATDRHQWATVRHLVARNVPAVLQQVPSTRRAADRHRRGHSAPHGGQLHLPPRCRFHQPTTPKAATGGATVRLWQPAAHPAALPVHSIRRAADRHQRGHGAPHRGPKRPRRAAGSIHPPCPRQPPEGPGCATRRPAAPPTALPVPSTHRASDHHRRGHGAPHRGPQRLRRAAGSIHPPRPRQPPEGPQCSIW